MIKFKLLFFMLSFGVCLGQEIDSTSQVKTTFNVENISIENFEEKHFIDDTYQCKKSTTQFKKETFLNIELLLPKNDSIYLDEFEGRLELTSKKSLKDSLGFGLLESISVDNPNLLYQEFQDILINNVFSGQALDFGAIHLENLNKAYWIKSDTSEYDFAFHTLCILFEDALNEKIFMIVLGAAGDLNKAICKYYPSIQSIKLTNK